MITSATQLKAKIRNQAHNNSQIAQLLLRNYIMERFLERVSRSEYRENFILKGGMLVASLVGINSRATMDIDTTIQALPLTPTDAEGIIRKIISIDIDDGVAFSIEKIASIMEEHDYPGIRIMLEAHFEGLRQMIKVDISTGDVITPHAIEYCYPLMFEERSISLLTYNIETLLAEKLETVLRRGEANTRMRDFYDLHILSNQRNFGTEQFREAFFATCSARNTSGRISELPIALNAIESNRTMQLQWENYKRDSFYVGDTTWSEVMASIKHLATGML